MGTHFTGEVGTDRPGPYLKVVNNVESAESCMKLCAEIADCVAFNYIGLESGKNFRGCFLNAEIYEPKPVEDVTSGVKISPLPQPFNVSVGTAKIGTSLATVKGMDSVEACMALYLRNAKCVSFRYGTLNSKANYRHCTLYGEVYPERPVKGATGGIFSVHLPATPTSSPDDIDSEKTLVPLFSKQTGTDRPDTFLKVVDDLASVDECMAGCAYNPECVAFNCTGVQSSTNYRRCMLSAVIYASKPDPEVTSSVKLSTLQHFYKLSSGTNRPDAYVERGDNVGSVEECMVLYVKNENCVAFNYIGLKVSWSYRRGFLNGEVHRKVPIPGITSDVLVIEKSDDPDSESLHQYQPRTLNLVYNLPRHMMDCSRCSPVQVFSVRSGRRWMMWKH